MTSTTPKLSGAQAQWDKAFQESKKALDSCYAAILGRHLCPAHAQKISQWALQAEAKDWPVNPGRKDV